MPSQREFLTDMAAILIETYWNVNDNEHLCFVKRVIILIETYWNVNADFAPALKLPV